jgi:hypothetical protein
LFHGYMSYTKILPRGVSSVDRISMGLTASGYSRSGRWPARSGPATAAKDKYEAPHAKRHITS